MVTPDDYRPVAIAIPAAMQPAIMTIDLSTGAIIVAVAIVIAVAADPEAEALGTGNSRRRNRNGR
jgi:hypothetical protein